MKIKSLFFDFDGIIADSVGCKTEAFRDIYLPYGEEIASKVVDHHLKNGGISRFEKFVTYHADFLGKTISQNELNNLCEKFSSLVIDKVIESKEINGFSEFIRLHGKKFNKWIITGTPTTEIINILKRRNMDDIFVDAFGSPEKKGYWTEQIIKNYNLNRDEIVFLGDAKADFEASQASGLKFILHRSEASGKYFDDKQFTEMNDYHDLWNILNNFK